MTDCVVIAPGSAPAAQAAARAAGLEPRVTMTKGECAGGLAPVRSRMRELGIAVVAVHSPDWDRQPLPALYELTALRLGAGSFVVVDGRGGVRSLSRTRLRCDVAALPLDTIRGLALAAREGARAPGTPPATAARGDAVLAIWPGAPGIQTGGAVTHVSGVLAALRRSGLRVGVLAFGDLPRQLSDIADEVEIAPAPSRGARTTGEIASLATNPLARAAGRRLLARITPRLVYQRHEAFATYGADLAAEAGAPLVLEWNNSEAWARRAWHVSSPLKRAFDPLARRMERQVLQRAGLIVAVSGHSAQMALEEGADPARVVVLPNGVDIEAIDRARNGSRPQAGGALLGWVGTFDPWHGAHVLVQALADLPDHVEAVLIGDGAERARCQALARDLGVDARITWTGALPHAEAVRRLAGCDVLVSPHVPLEGRPFFGSPTKIFEYMAIGRPIVASALEQIGEVLEDGRTARLVRPGDPDDLAAGIRSVLALPDRGAALGRAARQDAEAEHTWDARTRVVLQALGAQPSTTLTRSVP